MQGIDERKLGREIALQLSKYSFSKLVSTTGLAVMCGYGEKSPAIYDLINYPDFPKPIQLHERGKKRWIRDEVEEWIETHAAKRDNKPKVLTPEELQVARENLQKWVDMMAERGN